MKACNKQPYKDYWEAIRHASSLKERTGRKLYSYQCPKCGMWHHATADKRKGGKDIARLLGF